MTIDERLEFLVRNAESHDEQIGKLVEGMDKLTERMGVLVAQQEKTDLRFRQLADTMSEIALAVLDHERRLGKLDGGEA